MFTLAKKATLGVLLGATVLSAAAPAADAQRHGGFRGGRGGGGAALAAGLTGLAVGAAIAGGPRYGYYHHPYYYRRWGGCYDRWVWSRWRHHRVLVRYCD